jgi:hypothetical protein
MTREERIKSALARYEANRRTKRNKRKSVKLFSVGEPQRERAIMGSYETRERWEERVCTDPSPLKAPPNDRRQKCQIKL